eukprot:5060843-Amphidinium_carterae.3
METTRTEAIVRLDRSSNCRFLNKGTHFESEYTIRRDCVKAHSHARRSSNQLRPACSFLLADQLSMMKTSFDRMQVKVPTGKRNNFVGSVESGFGPDPQNHPC